MIYLVFLFADKNDNKATTCPEISAALTRSSVYSVCAAHAAVCGSDAVISPEWAAAAFRSYMETPQS